jgi:hypothetical protein
MLLFHGHPATTIANKFHGRQFILAYMGLIDAGRTTEAAFFCITAGIAQMARLFGNRATAFTCIWHFVSPFFAG